MKKLAAAFLILLFMLILEPALAADAAFVEIDGEIVSVYADADKNFVVLSTNDNIYNITIINDRLHTKTVNTEISSLSASYSYYNGSFSFFENGVSANDAPFFCVNVTVFDPELDLPRRSVINNAQFSGDCCAYNGDCYYFAVSDKVCVYSSDKRLAEEIVLDFQCSDIIPFEGGAYCVCPDSVVPIGDSSGMAAIRGSGNVTLLDDMVFCDGSILARDGALILGGLDEQCGAAAVGDHLITSKDGRLIDYDRSDGKLRDLGEIGQNTLIVGNGDICACFTPRGNGVDITLYSADDLIDIQSDSGSEPNSDPDILRRDTRTVTPAIGTTAYRLGKDVFDGAVFTKNGSPFTGRLATGVIMTWQGTDYTVVIMGDISGDGNINTTDIRLAEDVLFGSTELSGAFFTAGDIDKNGVFDLKDTREIYIRGKK